MASRQLKISELAYGTEKAKRLFREMMQQANFEFGFEAEDIPLMIEAIPMNAECIVLLITKVEDPEELDTRFARFSPGDREDGADDDDEYPFAGDFESDVAPMFSPSQPDNGDTEDSSHVQAKIFAFRTLSEVMSASSQIGKACPCRNSLYKDPKEESYLLVIWRGNATDDAFGRICNTLSEYGRIRRGSISADFLAEHCEVLLADNALQNLAF